MPESFDNKPCPDVIFASSNMNKYFEAEKILAGFGIKPLHYLLDLLEIQDDSLSKIAEQKSVYAYNETRKMKSFAPKPSAVIVEDDGLFIDSLSGFPGPFSSYAFKTLGNDGILKLVGNNRNAQFRAVIAYCDSNEKPKLFESSIAGTISENIQGKGWGYEPIFIPENQTKTYAELADKNKLSHRYEALKKFAIWFNSKRE